MRPEEPSSTPVPYWTHDRALGVGTFLGHRAPIRLKARLSTERYSEPAEINWFRRGEGGTHPRLHAPLSHARNNCASRRTQSPT
jgi:hypothetical protein